MSHATSSNLSPQYRTALYEQYPEPIIDEICAAEGTLRIGKQLPGERPLLFVPGFTEGFVAEAPFIADIASRNINVMMADQDIKGVRRGGAIRTQAMHSFSMVIASGVSRVDVFTHSMGSLVAEDMIRIADEEMGGDSPFVGAKVIMGAPAATNNHESLPSLGARFGKSMLLTEGKTTKDFPDTTKEMYKANQYNLLANPLRSAREIWALAHDTIDYPSLLKRNLALLAVLNYAEDDVFPHRVTESTMDWAMTMQSSGDTPLIYVTPISHQRLADGSLRMGRDASHNDQQFNPARVGAAVAQILRNY
jgi:hypothetical protein